MAMKSTAGALLRLDQWMAALPASECAVREDPIQARSALAVASITRSKPPPARLDQRSGNRRGDAHGTSLTALLSLLISPEMPLPPVLSAADSLVALSSSEPWSRANELTLAAVAAQRAGTLSNWCNVVLPPAATIITRLAAVDGPKAMGLWAHLVPARAASCTSEFPRAPGWVLSQQHRDGLAYPAGGGGACPDFNFLTVVLDLQRRGNISRDRAETAVSKMLRVLGDSLPIGELARESFRDQPLPYRQRRRLPKSAKHWTGRRTFRRYALGKGDWFSTLIRVITVLSAKTWLDRAPVDARLSIHHLGCWLPACPSTREPDQMGRATDTLTKRLDLGAPRASGDASIP